MQAIRSKVHTQSTQSNLFNTLNLFGFQISRALTSLIEAQKRQKLERGCQNGDIQSQYEMACLYLNQAQAGRAVVAQSLLRRAAQAGHAGAKYLLASLLETGRWGPPDVRQALDWFNQAAEEGYAPAQFRLGRIFENGELKSYQDYELSEKWYLMAALQDHVEAQFHLGDLFSDLKWRARDPVQALFWYMKAAENHHRLARHRRDSLYSVMDARQVVIAEDMLQRWEQIKHSRGRLIFIYREILAL